MTQSLITDIEARFEDTGLGTPIRYISADEMAYLKARACSLRAAAGQALFDRVAARLATLFRSRPITWQAGSAVPAK
jgi:hypothetical protein